MKAKLPSDDGAAAPRFIWPPYDFRPPTLQDLREQVWNPCERQLFPPKRVGWGFTINLHELLARLHIVRRH